MSLSMLYFYKVNLVKLRDGVYKLWFQTLHVTHRHKAACQSHGDGEEDLRYAELNWHTGSWLWMEERTSATV